jgi:hypothetical protein
MMSDLDVAAAMRRREEATAKKDAWVLANPTAPVTWKTFRAFQKETRAWHQMIVEAIGKNLVDVLATKFKAFGARLDAHEKELAELKARPPTLADTYRGVWQPGEHQRGAVVTMNGGLWLCFRTTTAKPGAGDDWRLVVKAGRDGKDARP